MKKRNNETLGIIGFCFAIFSFIIPFVGSFLAIIGLILSIIQLGKNSKSTFGIWALVINILSLIFSIVIGTAISLSLDTFLS